MSVLIDPYMFEISEEQMIKDNIGFFRRIIQMSAQPDYKIIMYAGLIEKLQKRAVQPFPIHLDFIQDKQLKETIAILNTRFSNALLSSIEGIDIDVCDGEQDFSIEEDPEIYKDELYFEMANMLLIPCYNSHLFIEDRILTGITGSGKRAGDAFLLKCSCLKKCYEKKCMFSSVEDFLPVKEQVVEQIFQLKKTALVNIAATVPANMGSHHNHVQNDGKKFSTVDDLSLKNKRVLKLLTNLGLSRVIFGAFTPKGVKGIGTIDITSVEEKETQDILKGKFYAETEMQIEIDLYFPKGIGRLLQSYFDNNSLTYKNVSELLEKVS